MHERTNIQLSAADRRELEAVAANRNSPQKHVWRAKIVLLTADDHGTAEIMRATGKAKTVIWRWQERFGEEHAAPIAAVVSFFISFYLPKCARETPRGARRPVQNVKCGPRSPGRVTASRAIARNGNVFRDACRATARLPHGP